MLKLFLLGRPIITFNDAPVTDFVSNKALVLLCYLAMNPGDHAREKLATLLWGEMTADRAKANLRMALYNVQKQLPNSLDANRKTVAFTEDTPYWLDVHDFVRGCQDESDIAQLETAVALYRDEFLADISIEDAPELDDWLRIVREQYRLQVLSALHRVAEHYTARGDWERSLAVTRKLLSLEPWQESSHRKMMRLLARVGDYNAALAQYDACKQILADELDVEPMPETTALYRRIRAARVRPGPVELPLQPTPLQGRDTELGRLHQLLINPERRLITIGGPGGIGKTRLALACAAAHSHDFLDGVAFVPLAGLESASGLAPAVAAALNLTLSGKKPPQAQLLDFMRDKELLLILDNLEHLLEASVPLLTAVLDTAPQVTLLVTSREYLNLRWEFRLPLAGLAYPPEAAASEVQPQRGEAYSALRLFAETAVRVQPTFSMTANQEAAAQICRLVDGLPLGIELAATLTDRIACAQIAAQIKQNMDTLASSMRDMVARHRSLRAVFEQSWALLNKAEKQTLAQLSLFRGGFDLGAATAVTQTTRAVLHSLIRQSLVRPSANDRYDLHEVIRQYAAEKLAENPTENESSHRCFAKYYTAFVAEQAPLLARQQATGALAALRQDLDNIRAAWQWAVANRQPRPIQQVFPGLARYYDLSNLYDEGAEMLAAAAQTIRDAVRLPADAWVIDLLAAQAHFLNLSARYEEAIGVAETAVTLAQSHQLPHLTAAARLRWGQALLHQGLFDEAGPYLTQALETADAAGQLQIAAQTRVALTTYLEHLGDVTQARTHVAEALDIYEELADIWGQARTLRRLGAMAGHIGQYDRSRELYSQALHFCQRLDDKEGAAGVYNNLGAGYLDQGQFAKARENLERALQLRRELGALQNATNTLINLGNVAGMMGQFEEAQAYLEEVLALVRDVGSRRAEGVILNFLGFAVLCRQRLGAAQALFQEALAVTESVGAISFAALARFRLGQIAWICGQTEATVPVFEDALQVARESTFSFLELDVMADLGLLYQEVGNNEAALATSVKAVEAARAYNRPPAIAHALTRRADVLAGQEKWPEAETGYREANEIRHALAQPHLAVEAWAGLARAAMAQNDTETAMTYGEQILNMVEKQELWGVLRPLPIYHTCHQILLAQNDAHATPLLHLARRRLQTIVATLTDEALRQSFLENVSVQFKVFCE